jgi:predicted TPR repeat methyltransferase
MSYEQFAYIYDQLMDDVSYENWLYYVERIYRDYQHSGKRILDVGCGTGALSIQLAQQAFNVTGIDLSEDMLTVARSKAENKGLHIPLFQQDMSSIIGLGEFDTIVIFCDSLNYLKTEKEVRQTFKGVYDHLREGGLLLFDVHSTYKMKHLFAGQTYGGNDPQLSYLWQCFEGEYLNSVEHELTFFSERDDGTYERFDELHFQRTFPVEQYEQWLRECAFEVLEITGDFLNSSPSPDTERVFFAAKKR